MISIIIPVYNVASYLKTALLSALSQKVDAEMEIIAVDDGSTDDSGVILDDFALSYPCIKVVHRTNKGVSAARNTGLSMARGNLLTFLDADDVLLPNALRVLWEAQKEFDGDVTCGNIYRFDSDKNLRHIPGNSGKKKSPEIKNAEEAMEAMLYQTWHPFEASVSGKLFKKELFRNCRFQENSKFEDLELLPRLMENAKKVVWVDSYVYGYRKNPDSFMNQWSERRLDILDVLETMGESALIKNSKRLQKALGDRSLSAALNIFLLLEVYNREDGVAKARCADIIRKEKYRTLFNPNVRLKNRLGAFAALFGEKAVIGLNRISGMVKG